MKVKNIFWGILFVLGGIVLLMSAFGYIHEVNIFSLLLIILLMGLAIMSLFKLNFFGVFYPLALIVGLYGVALGLPEVSGWMLFIAATLGSIGCTLLFRRPKAKSFTMHSYSSMSGMKEGEEYTTHHSSENRIVLETRFSGSTQYIHSKNFEAAYLNCSFGGMEVYFDKDVEMEKESAELILDVKFSGVQLYIPRNWKVENRASAAFGSIEDHRSFEEHKDKVLIIKGNVRFGGVEIYYI